MSSATLDVIANIATTVVVLVPVIIFVVIVTRIRTFIKCAVCGRRYILLVPWFIHPASRGWLQWGSDYVCPDCIEIYCRSKPHMEEAIKQHYQHEIEKYKRIW